jgi:hypothetical protein
MEIWNEHAIKSLFQVCSFRSTEIVPCSSECSRGSSSGRGISIHPVIFEWCGSHTATGWCIALHGAFAEGKLQNAYM